MQKWHAICQIAMQKQHAFLTAMACDLADRHAKIACDLEDRKLPNSVLRTLCKGEGRSEIAIRTGARIFSTISTLCMQRYLVLGGG